MSGFQTIAYRVEIEALRGEFTDAAMMRGYDRLASLFTPHGVLRMPNIPVELDRYQRTGDGWKFTERVYEIRYEDTTPLAGSPPAQPSRPPTRRPRTPLRREDDGDHGCTAARPGANPSPTNGPGRFSLSSRAGASRGCVQPRCA